MYNLENLRIMKKYLLFITIGMMCCAGVMAQETWTPVKTTQMNPFAYNLSAELSADQTTLTVKYCLNADVTSLNIVIKKGGQEYTYPVTENSKLKKNKATDPSQPYDPYLSSNTASHVVDIPTSELASTLGTGTFEWRIEVKGAGRANCGVYSLDGTNVYSHKFYRPSSVDIVQDPTSFNYGKVLVVESQHTVSSKTGYHSSSKTKTKGIAAGNTDPQGAGVYVFNPDLTPRENTSGTYVFNGKSDSRFANTSFSPHRVRVSEDGRMFVTSMDHTKGAILWEIDNYFSTWTTVMGAGVGGAKYNTSTYDLTTSGGSFIAGPNAGFDVRGTGSELTLLMLSCDKTAFAADHTGFECREYKLGKATTWSTVPSKDFDTNEHVFVSERTSNVQYDKDGGIWCVSYRAECNNDQPGLVHKTAAGAEDCRILRSNTKNAALRFNKTFTRAMMASEGNYGALYDYIPDHGSNNASQGYFFNQRNIDMSAVGSYLNDFAWDNANNIYAVGQVDAQNGGNGHLVVYCLPYNANDVFTTPGPSDFTINCKEGLTYTVTTTVNNPTMGSVTGGGTIQSCEPITLTATPNEQYRFVNWTVGGKVVSEANPYTFIVTQNIEVTANFAPAVFNVTWYNLFQEDKDITDYITNPNSVMDGAVNTRLWRLFQVALNEAITEKKGKNRSDQANFTVNGITHFNIAVFIAGDADNILLDFIGVTDNTSSQLSVRPFKWLGPYIKYALAQQGINSTSTGLTYWKGMLYRFFNRSNKAYTTNAGAYNYGEGDFTEYGKPTHWRSWWADIACELEPKMNYNTPMPITWDKSYTPTTSIVQNGGGTLTPGNWYKWNPKAEDANKLLAWRYGDSTKLPSDQTLGPIVHNAYQDGALFATWVDKTISENKDNTDVTLLLGNEKHGSNTHNILVERKFLPTVTDYNTLCLPFSLNSLAGTPYQGATILDFTGTTLQTIGEEVMLVLNFTQVNAIEAGKPYLIQPNSNLGDSYTFSNISYSAVPEPTAKSVAHEHATFHAVLNPGVVTIAADAPTLILVDQNRLALVSQNGEMKGLRGYFTLSPEMASVASNGRCYLSISKPAPTDVEVLTDPQPEARQQVQKIMRNGQIFIIRDGETYTITGQKVR